MVGRRRLGALVVFIAVLSAGGCAYLVGDALVVKEQAMEIPAGYELIFADEFESFTLDTAGDGSQTWAPWWTGWGVRVLDPNGETAWKCDESYVGAGAEPLGVVLHERTDRSTLKLYGRRTPRDRLANSEGYPHVGGMITSQNSFAARYGYFEVRCRFELSAGHHWGIWLVPQDNTCPPEIDMVEVLGRLPNVVFMNAHGLEPAQPLTYFTADDTSAFHTYGFLWTPAEMVWYFDGVERKRVPNFVDVPMHIMVSPEIGGRWHGPTDETTVWPTFCEVDWVRVWQGPTQRPPQAGG